MCVQSQLPAHAQLSKLPVCPWTPTLDSLACTQHIRGYPGNHRVIPAPSHLLLEGCGQDSAEQHREADFILLVAPEDSTLRSWCLPERVQDNR